MKVEEDTWKFIQQHLGYTDEELELFRNNPRIVDMISKAPGLMNKTIIAEVVESHGCNSQHKVGDRFYFDGAGNLLTKLNPKRICIHALSVLSAPIMVVNELFYAGADPNDMRLNRVGCCDGGVRCGGWGHIAMEIKVEQRK